MGIEYVLRVTGKAGAVLDSAESERLVSALQSVDPNGSTADPHVSVSLVPGGLFICDHLSNREVSSRVLGGAVRRLASKGAQVTVEET